MRVWLKVSTAFRSPESKVGFVRMEQAMNDSGDRQKGGGGERRGKTGGATRRMKN